MLQTVKRHIQRERETEREREKTILPYITDREEIYTKRQTETQISLSYYRQRGDIYREG